jgi:hypothetical protein
VPLEAKDLTGSAINTADFKVEAVVITVVQRLGVRKLLQENGVKFTPNQEGAAIPLLLEHLQALAKGAGGEPPLPAVPNTSYLDEIARDSGNAQLLAVYNARERITEDAYDWRTRATAIKQRLPRWQTLQKLLAHARDLPGVTEVQEQANAIKTGRRLLTDPDPVPALCATLTDTIRAALTTARDAYVRAYEQYLADLQSMAAWAKLTAAQQQKILEESSISAAPAVKVATEADLLASCDEIPIQEWRNRTDALTQRFANARLAAQKIVAPQAVVVTLPKGSVSTVDDARVLLTQFQQIGDQIMAAIENGIPVLVQ